MEKVAFVQLPEVAKVTVAVALIPLAPRLLKFDRVHVPVPLIVPPEPEVIETRAALVEYIIGMA